MLRHLGSACVVAAVAAVIGRTPEAKACGPDLPVELLSDRGAVMSDLPEGVFLEEITRLVAPPGPYASTSGEADRAVLDRAGDLERSLYGAGAEAFHAGDHGEARLAFERLLALPPAMRQIRSTSAAYTLARIRAAGDDVEGAIEAYISVRTLADEGFADPLALASASLGQQARLLLDRGGPGDTLHALHLYAEQAALPGGDPSLLFVVRELLDPAAPPARLDEVLAAPLGQRLLALFLSTRGDELDEAVRERLWTRLVAIDGVAGGDHLATAAYRRGEWDVAARLVAQADDTPRARWVRAKLALRAGDRATAEILLASAAAGFADDDATRARVTGERATLALAEGRVLDAMDHAWAIRDRYPDALFLAERVLTLDELTAFVERIAPATPASASDEPTWGLATGLLMRDTLGRRLMRAGRYRDALAYLAPGHRLPALRYARAIFRADTTDRVARAGALLEASRIARRDGLEILGTTLAPDWGLYEGQYDPGAWSDEPPPPPTAWHSHAEDVRVAASSPSPVRRFHYRFIASRLAEQAADLLPHQSQAFGVSLCLAARHVRFRAEERVQALYARYLDEGPMFTGMDFGITCPEPELERARRFLPAPAEPRWPIAVIAAVYFVGALFVLRRLRPGRLPAGLAARP